MQRAIARPARIVHTSFNKSISAVPDEAISCVQKTRVDAFFAMFTSSLHNPLSVNGFLWGDF